MYVYKSINVEASGLLALFVSDEGLPSEDDYYTENAIDRLIQHAAQK